MTRAFNGLYVCELRLRIAEVEVTLLWTRKLKLPQKLQFQAHLYMSIMRIMN